MKSSKILMHLPQTHNETMQSFGSVLRKYRKQRGLSQTELGNIMKTTRNTVTNWETDKSKPDYDVLHDLVTMLGIPLYELFGIENQELPSPKESTMLRMFRQLSPVNQAVVSAMVSAMLSEETNARDKILRETFSVVALLQTPAAAGPGCDFNDLKPEAFFVRKTTRNEHADAVVRVSGRSMEPLYHDGDLVYLQFADSVDEGEDAVCSTADGAVIKRVHDNKLYSLNQSLPFGDKSEDDHVITIGKVLGIVSADDLPADKDLPVLEELKSREIREFRDKYERKI